MMEYEPMPEIFTDIYAVLDQSGEVRYVGRTRCGVRERLINHSHQRTVFGQWVRDNHEHIKVKVLESVPWRQEAKAEQRWIDHYVDANADLFNKRKKLKFASAILEERNPQ